MLDLIYPKLYGMGCLYVDPTKMMLGENEIEINVVEETVQKGKNIEKTCFWHFRPKTRSRNKLKSTEFLKKLTI